MEKIRLLVTSVGSLVATNLLESLDSLGRERFFVVGTNSEAEALNNFACDVVHLVPPSATGAAFHDALEAIARLERPDLWVPSRDDDVLELARLAAARTLPGQVLAGTPEAAEVICDKWLSACFARDHGLRIAPTARGLHDALQLAESHGFPLICKPRRGFGSRGSRLVFDARQLTRACVAADVVVQAMISPAADIREQLPDVSAGFPLWYTYVDPGQYSSQWVIAPDGEAIEIGATLNTMHCGRPDRSLRVDDPALTGTAGGYARALARAGWRGPLNVQCRRTPEGEFVMFELAGRISGGLGGREALGIAELWQTFAAFLPDRLPRPTPAAGVAIARKQLCTRGIDAASLDALVREGVWRHCS